MSGELISFSRIWANVCVNPLVKVTVDTCSDRSHIGALLIQKISTVMDVCCKILCIVLHAAR